ncbi:MAG: hypothetical protein LBJ44_04800 [Propionibacteriaceae bacterium]|nr:hypothetical protein [Propionibacteriaceae bacterium]
MLVRYPEMATCLPGWIVIHDLDDLRGPTSGHVELPINLYWGPSRPFDLDDPDDLRWCYVNVLREASDEATLAEFLNRCVLEREWNNVFLPLSLRRAWTEAHPSLASVAA